MRLDGLAEQLPGGIGGLDVPAALTSGPAIELVDGQSAQVPLHVIGDSTGIDVDEKAVGDLLGLLTEFGMPAEQRIEHDSLLAGIERVEGRVLLGSVPFPRSSAFHPASPVGSPVGGCGLSTLRRGGASLGCTLKAVRRPASWRRACPAPGGTPRGAGIGYRAAPPGTHWRLRRRARPSRRPRTRL